MICYCLALNRKTGKEIRFGIPATFPDEGVEKLRRNTEFKRINGTDVPNPGAATIGLCHKLKQELRDERSARLREFYRAQEKEPCM